MSRARALLLDVCERLFAELSTRETIDRAEEGEWPQELWRALEENGLPLALVPEAAGGVGLSPGDAMAVMRLVGRFAAPVPLVETVAAGWLLSRAGLEVPDGPLGIAPVSPRDSISLVRNGGSRLEGRSRGVPWGSSVSALAVVVAADAGTHRVVVLDPARCESVSGRNLAGEPRDDLRFDGVPIPEDAVGGEVGAEELWLHGALGRVSLMAGAMERLLDLCLEHASGRIQFGRPIGRFQAVQQQLAVLAGEVSAARVAAEAASEEAGTATARLAIGAAKARVSEGVARACSIAHQIHGALGFTHEHVLHQLTRRLWSWRDEFGTETDWSAVLGHRVMESGADGLWELLTGVPD